MPRRCPIRQERSGRGETSATARARRIGRASLRGALACACALPVVVVVGCFDGAFLLGEPCSVDRDCAPTYQCIDNVCGGPSSDPTGGSESEDSADSESAAEVVCGDGIVEGDEDCDDGNLDDSDSCLTGCVLARCGDGVVRVGFEACDDGNDDDADHCTNDCAAPVCGDGRVGGDEACDDGNQANDDACLNGCQPAACGDGVVWVGHEKCDDGNMQNDDACAHECTLARQISAVATGELHTCVVLDTSGVRCWGDNGAGQLGYPGITWIGATSTPAAIYQSLETADVQFGAPGAQEIVAGARHTCVRVSGAVRCWGSGQYGQLGYGVPIDFIGKSETPATYYANVLQTNGVVPLFGAEEQPVTVIQLAAGYDHTCALLEDYNVRCWGRNQYGQLGYGTSEDAIGDDETPGDLGSVDLGPGARVIELVAGGYHTCALLEINESTPGEVRCWGGGGAGQLGYGSDEDIGRSETPAAYYAGLAGGGAVPFLFPEEVGVARVTRLVAGGRHTCAQLGTASVRCWGSNSNGQLGYGANELTFDGSPNVGDDETPLEYYELLEQHGVGERGDVAFQDADAPSPVARLSAGEWHTCVRLGDERLHCWGDNGYGQLGYGRDEDVGDDETPLAYYKYIGLGETSISVRLGGDVGGVSAGKFHNCALMTHGGSVRCWGLGADGRLGYGAQDDVGDDERPIDYYPGVPGGNGDVEIY